MPSLSNDRRPGLYIVGGAKQDTFAAIDPEKLAAVDPVWQHDVSSFGPWVKLKQGHPDLPSDLLPLWRAEAYDGPSTVFIVGSCRSSMDVAREMIRLDCLPPWGSVLAVEQSAGRGQKQRHWISPPGNIHGSWFWPQLDTITQDASVSWRPLASLLAGAIMAQGMEDKGVSIRIKWPNDLMADRRKLCGLLVEDRGGHLIVGAGINLVSAPDDHLLRDDFVLSAIRLNDLMPATTPLSIWLYLIDSGRQRLMELIGSLTPEEFVRILEARMAWIGRKVLVTKGEAAPFEAVFTGLAKDGGLCIRRGAANSILYTGSLLPIEY